MYDRCRSYRMKLNIIHHKAGETIPVKEFVKKRKLIKYFNKETSSSIVCIAQLLKGITLEPSTPFYYGMGLIQYEDFGLENIATLSRDPQTHQFSQQHYIQTAMPSVSPLSQFKVLYNMPLSFVAIEHNLQGDCAVVYANAHSLVTQAMYAPTEHQILIGASQVFEDGSVTSGFALVSKDELPSIDEALNMQEPIELFYYLKERTDAK